MRDDAKSGLANMGLIGGLVSVSNVNGNKRCLAQYGQSSVTGLFMDAGKCWYDQSCTCTDEASVCESAYGVRD